MLTDLGTQTLQTERLILRRFTLEDAETVFHTWTSDSEVTKYLRYETHESVETTREVIGRWVNSYDSPDFYLWGITLKENGALIGSISGSTQSETDDIADVGYCIGRAYWAHGYMTEALQAVIRFLIFSVGFNRVEACHSKNNPASGRVMQKAGMICEGLLRQGYRSRIGYQDSYLYSILREDLEKLQAPQKVDSAQAGVVVRAATEADYAAVARLEEQVFRLHWQNRPDLFRPGYVLPEAYFQSLLADPGYTVLVAALGTAQPAVGFCILKTIPHDHAVNQPYTTLFIDDFCVDGTCRRQGIGKALFAKIRSLAVEMGAKNIELNVWVFNSEAIAFYQSLGFVVNRQRMEMDLTK